MGRLAPFIAGLAALVVLVALWAITLWFAVRPEFSALSPALLLALHAAPPVLVWLGGWLGLRAAQRRRNARSRAAEAAELRERERAAEAVRLQQREVLVRRRMALPLLAAVVAPASEQAAAEAIACADGAMVVLPADEDEWPAEAGRSVAGLATDSADGSAADWQVLHPIIERVLHETLAVCPAAAAFPVGVVCPPGGGREALIAKVRTTMAEYCPALAVDAPGSLGRHGDAGVRVAPFEPGEHPVASIFAAFDDDPAMPGMLLLVADSPRLSAALAEGLADDLPAPVREIRRWLGEPAQAVVSLVVGSSRLGEMLTRVEAAAGAEAAGDAPVVAGMRPYWEAGHQVPAELAALAALDPAVRADLAAATPLGRLHRCAGGAVDAPAGRVGVLAASVRRILECGLVNAGLLSLPGLDADVPAAGDSGQPPEAVVSPAVDWLVHNAGGIDVAGPRLAAVSLAMHQLHVDLNPIDEATNFPVRVGDLGLALPFAMLAHAAGKASETAGPACWAHFFGDAALRMGVITPGAAPLVDSASVAEPIGGAA